MVLNKKTICVAFLVVLYIAPAILYPTYTASTILAQPNTAKEFTPSLYWDTWFNESFAYRKPVYIDSGGGDAGGGDPDIGCSYPVEIPITYDDKMQADFDDLRFTDDDKTTELAYWRESYTASTSAVFWVLVTDDLGYNQTIYMYYGNSEVSTTSDGESTFWFFDDFENNNLDRWDDVGTDWSVQSTVVKMGTYAGYGNSAGDRNLRQIVNETITIDTFAVHTWIYVYDVAAAYKYPIHMWDTTNIGPVIMLEDDWIFWNGGSNMWEAGTISQTTWYELDMTFEFNGEMTLYIDNVEIGSDDFVDYSDSAVTSIDWLGSLTNGAATRDQWIDDYYLRPWVDPEPALNSFGTEEFRDYEPPSWHEIDEITIYLFVEPLEWGLDVFFLFLGLFLIPASTIYFVKGGKDEMSTDKVFFFLIAFMIGWALFLGGLS